MESGEGCSSATPVYDGYALIRPTLRTPVAGAYLSECNRSILETEDKMDLTPGMFIKSKEATSALNDQKPSYEKRENIRLPVDTESGEEAMDEKDDDETICRLTKSYYDWAVSNIVKDWQQNVCQVSEVAYDPEVIANIPTVPYEFPNGHTGQFGVTRFEGTERLFDVQFHGNSKRDDAVADSAVKKLGLHELVHQTISACDIDMRSSMYSGIIVSGGTTLFPGFSDRLYNEVFNFAPPVSVFLLV